MVNKIADGVGRTPKNEPSSLCIFKSPNPQEWENLANLSNHMVPPSPPPPISLELRYVIVAPFKSSEAFWIGAAFKGQSRVTLGILKASGLQEREGKGAAVLGGAPVQTQGGKCENSGGAGVGQESCGRKHRPDPTHGVSVRLLLLQTERKEKENTYQWNQLSIGLLNRTRMVPSETKSYMNLEKLKARDCFNSRIQFCRIYGELTNTPFLK